MIEIPPIKPSSSFDSGSLTRIDFQRCLIGGVAGLALGIGLSWLLSRGEGLARQWRREAGVTAGLLTALSCMKWEKRSEQPNSTERESTKDQDHIELPNEHLPYKRQELSLVTEESRNPPTELNRPPQGIDSYAGGAIFYGYNAEGIRDYGWGCAWRAIQTSLSSYGLQVSFANLFHTFGPLDSLRKIYQDKYPSKNLTSLKEFAPYDTSSGWAEPFIGEMVLHFYGIPADLESINGIPRDCHAPKSVFHRPSLSFSAFKCRLENHFKIENSPPIIIDDGTYTFNIIGIGYRDLVTTLWIADPHIQEGVNRLPTEKTTNGLYTIDLNDSGKQISCSLDGEDQHQKSNLFSSGSYRGLHFNQKNWMVLFPKSQVRCPPQPEVMTIAF
jgi:Peptidase family C78